MDVANEILDAIEIIVDKKIRENTAQIYPGICKSISGNTCVMSVNGKNNTVQFYGSTPAVGSIYRVFVPDGNMSMAFAITGNDDRKGLQYSNPNLLDNWYFGNPINQRGQTSYTGTGYGIDRWKMTGDGNPNLILGDNYITYNGVGNTNLAQDVEGKFAGKTLTLSFLLKDPVNCMITIRKPDWNVFSGFAIRGDSGLYSVTATIPNDYTEDRIRLTLCAGASGESVAHSAGIFASKLELGSQQTLAHQENGVWVLNEIPNYGEQLARCQRYFCRMYCKCPPKNSSAANDNQNGGFISFPVTMRTNPAGALISKEVSTIGLGETTVNGFDVGGADNYSRSFVADFTADL